MKKRTIFSITVIIVCLFIVINKQIILNMILSLKYPSPIEYYGLLIPVDNGVVYSKNDKLIRISNHFENSYSIIIRRDFGLSQNESIENYLKKLGHILIQVKEHNENAGYYKIYSVDRVWSFNVTHYFPSQKLMLMYSGTKKNYDKYKKILRVLTKSGSSGDIKGPSSGDSI